jgi:hypothetical protein
MLEIAQYFEQVTAGFRPIVLIASGLAAVLVGLFIWLGGLGVRRVLLAVVGAITGGICGFFIIGLNIASALILAAGAAIIAIMFEKIFITILAASLAAVFGFAVLAKPYTEISADFSTEIKRACLQMPLYCWAIIVALAVIFILAGFFLWRLTSALCCATLGTFLIFTGMILLLLYKGAAPISSLYSRAPFYAAIFAAMTAFGTMEQLLLCQRAKEKLTRRKETNKGKKGPHETRMSWRTR